MLLLIFVRIIAPQLAINGSESVNITFNEEIGRLPLFREDNRVSIIDSDSTHLTEAILTLAPGGNASLESLRLDLSSLPQGMAPQTNYQSEQGLLIITGNYTTVEYESILSAVVYVSTNRNPDDRMRPIVSCRVRDTSNLLSNNVTMTMLISAYNDPPVIYLGGQSKLNYSITLPEAGSSRGLPVANSSVQIPFRDPDTSSIQFVQFVLELQNPSGNRTIDLDIESLNSPSGLLNQDQNMRNVYYLNGLGTASHPSYAAFLPEVVYVNANPSAVVSGTRVVRVTALDVDLVTSAGSRLRGLESQPSFTFIHVGEEPSSPTASTAPPSTVTEQQQTSTLTVTTITSDTAEDTTSVIFDRKLECPEELNVPLVPGSTLGLLVYNWTQTAVEEVHAGLPCPVVS